MIDPPRQCKDIPDQPILEYLEELWRRGGGSSDSRGRYPNWPATWFDPYIGTPHEYPKFGSPGEYHFLGYVAYAMPPGTIPRLVLRKMGMLIRRKLVDGCACGCTGRFFITEKGSAYLQSLQTSSAKESNP